MAGTAYSRLDAPAAVLAALAIWCCGSPGFADALAGSERAHLTRTVTLPPDAIVAVTASVGDITVSGWQQPDTQIDIERRAETSAGLERVQPVIEQADGRLTISALQAGDAFDRSTKTSIRIQTPSSTAFESISLLDGRISLTNLAHQTSALCRDGGISASKLRGAVRLETSTGDIKVDEATLDRTGFIRLRAFNGKVALQLASRPRDARILALTFNGTIASDIPLQMKDRFGPRFGEATLGNGEPMISIDVVTGNIEIKAP